MIAVRRPPRTRRRPGPLATHGFTLLLLLLAGLALAREPGRDAVATAHPLATDAGLEILAAGGNAFDAAVAISAALAVVEPYGSGLGGGGFYLLRETGEPVRYRFLDARERAPLAIRDADFRAQGQRRPERSLNGPLAAGIPGLPAALVHLAARHGRLPLATSLAPAIDLARTGFPVDAVYRQRAGWRLAALRDDPESARLFLVNGALPPEGHRLRQPELAGTLQRLAGQGTDGFYRGVTAERLVTAVRAAGGVWSRQDLDDYRVVERPPLRFDLGEDGELIGAPPPSAGGLILAQSLGLLQRLGWRQADPLQRSHLVIEALRRAYRDRGLLGDPDFVEAPIAPLLSEAYLDRLAAGIDPTQATPSDALPPAPAWREGDHTTHFSVMDAAGNAVAATLSLNLMFGAAFTVPGTGVLLNDQMDDFAIDPQGYNVYGLSGSPANALAGGKRPLSSMSPTFMESESAFASFGTPGGSRIPSTVLLAVLAQLDGVPVADWVARRRYHHQYLPDVVEYEDGAFSVEEREALRRRGHRLEPMRRAYGNLQVIFWDKRRGHVAAASDPRGLGNARLQGPAATAD